MQIARNKLDTWCAAVAILGAALLVIGAVLALANPRMLADTMASGDPAIRIFAGYIASRNLSIAILLIAGLLLKKNHLVATLLLLAGLVQWIDAVFDVVEARWPVVPLVVILGSLFFAAARKVWSNAYGTDSTSSGSLA